MFVRPHFNGEKLDKAHTYHLATVVSLKQEDCSPGWEKVKTYLKNNQGKKGWRHDSSSRELA
jgi:hypothetical protein